MTANTPIIEQTRPQADVQAGVRRYLVKGLSAAAILALILMVSAGRWDWWWGWLYVGLLAGWTVLTTRLLSPGLIAERSTLQKGTKKWDIWMVSLAASLLPIATLVVAGLDGEPHLACAGRRVGRLCVGLRAGHVEHVGQRLLLGNRSHPDRARAHRLHGRAVPHRAPSGLSWRDPVPACHPHHAGIAVGAGSERAGGGALRHPHRARRPHADRRTARLPRVHAADALQVAARNLVSTLEHKERRDTPASQS